MAGLNPVGNDLFSTKAMREAADDDTPEVKVRVAAARRDHPCHGIALQWLRGGGATCVGDASCKRMPRVAARLLRSITTARIFHQPAPPEDAMAFLDAPIVVPGTEIPVPGGEWPVMRLRCMARQHTANVIPDAWLAATVLRLGEPLITCDAELKRRPGHPQVTVRWAAQAGPYAIVHSGDGDHYDD
jgi:uncharacterized protein